MRCGVNGAMPSILDSVPAEADMVMPQLRDLLVRCLADEPADRPKCVEGMCFVQNLC